jgi:hypothetical protein
MPVAELHLAEEAALLRAVQSLTAEHVERRRRVVGISEGDVQEERGESGVAAEVAAHLVCVPQPALTACPSSQRNDVGRRAAWIKLQGSDGDPAVEHRDRGPGIQQRQDRFQPAIVALDVGVE